MTTQFSRVAIVVCVGLIAAVVATANNESTEQPTVEPQATTTTIKTRNSGLEGLRNTGQMLGGYADVAAEALDPEQFLTGYDWKRLTKAAGVNGEDQQGAFRTECVYSHLLYDDPLLYPGQTGAAHLHLFWGNTAANAQSTAQSLPELGDGSCAGGPLNRSAYWMPAVLDGQRRAVIPYQILVYYKTGYFEPVSEIKPFPAGFSMIAMPSEHLIQFECYLDGLSGTPTPTELFVGQTFQSMTPCIGKDDMIQAVIRFPSCWNGGDDPIDHTAHVTYNSSIAASGRVTDTKAACPESHPIPLPQVTYQIRFEIDDTLGDWCLSSDLEHGAHVPTGCGSSLHADFMTGWNPDVLNGFIEGCLRAFRNCQTISLGQPGNTYKTAKALKLPEDLDVGANKNSKGSRRVVLPTP